MAGCLAFNQVRQVIICESAMEAIAWMHFRSYIFPETARLLFLATGIQPNPAQFRKLANLMPACGYLLVFGNDLLSRIAELKAAACLRKLPLMIALDDETALVDFRLKTYNLPVSDFSVPLFEKHSRYRFKLKTAKAKTHNTFLQQLQALILNH